GELGAAPFRLRGARRREEDEVARGIERGQNRAGKTRGGDEARLVAKYAESAELPPRFRETLHRRLQDRRQACVGPVQRRDEGVVGHCPAGDPAAAILASVPRNVL